MMMSRILATTCARILCSPCQVCRSSVAFCVLAFDGDAIVFRQAGVVEPCAGGVRMRRKPLPLRTAQFSCVKHHIEPLKL